MEQKRRERIVERVKQLYAAYGADEIAEIVADDIVEVEFDLAAVTEERDRLREALNQAAQLIHALKRGGEPK